MNLSSFRRWLEETFPSSSPEERAKLLIAPVTVLLAAMAAGYFLYVRSEAIMQEQLRERLKVTAAMAVGRIDASLVEGVRGPKDATTPKFRTLLKQVQDIRAADPKIRHAYVMRKTEDEYKLAFVVDADLFVSPAELDRDKDGVLEEDERPAQPGELYDVWGKEFVTLRLDAFKWASADKEVTKDQWGNYISGYAPIRNAKGDVIAALGIDMDAEQFETITHSVFTPVLFLLVVLGGLLGAGYLLFLWNRTNIMALKKIDAERSGLLQLTFHQLGEPITIMQWSLETLSDNLTLEQLEKYVPEHITTMNEGLRRLNAIIDTLQMAEKIDLGSVEFHPASLELNPLLHEVADKYKTLLESAQQTLTIRCDDGISLFADRDYLKVVLSEVIGNAIAYSTKHCTVDVRVHPEQKTVHIDVQDHGCGIPAADMHRLFQKYMRGSNARLHKPDGNGLGLYICKGIIEGMGGEISVDSVENVGTKVSITLPIGQPES